jgi:Pumilio-family RNA binding repeat
MMKDRYGNYVIQKCIEVSKGKQRDILIKKITACANVLRKQANYSRHVYNFIEKFCPEGGDPNNIIPDNEPTGNQMTMHMGGHNSGSGKNAR